MGALFRIMISGVVNCVVGWCIANSYSLAVKESNQEKNGMQNNIVLVQWRIQDSEEEGSWDDCVQSVQQIFCMTTPTFV